MFTSEMIYATVKNSASRYQTLIDGTVESNKPHTIRQDLTKYPDAKPLSLSINERTGIEFAYSFFLYVMPATFSSAYAVFKHVFHKGYAEPWPLIGPGVFMHGNTNTMRIVMNTYSDPFAFVDIENIPVQKWFHVVLNCYKGGLDVYINGHLASRMPFTNTLPYQNFQDIHLFSDQHNTTIANMPSLKGETFQIADAFKGYLSNLVYARYALSVSEIQGLLKKGPAEIIRQVDLDKPPYFSDNWCASQR